MENCFRAARWDCHHNLQLCNTQIIVWWKKPGALTFKNPKSTLFVIHHISYANVIRFLGWQDHEYGPIQPLWDTWIQMVRETPKHGFCSKTAKRNFNYFKSQETTFSLSYFCHANNVRHFSIVEWSSEKENLLCL